MPLKKKKKKRAKSQNLATCGVSGYLECKICVTDAQGIYIAWDLRNQRLAFYPLVSQIHPMGKWKSLKVYEWYDNPDVQRKKLELSTFNLVRSLRYLYKFSPAKGRQNSFTASPCHTLKSIKQGKQCINQPSRHGGARCFSTMHQ